MFFFIIFKLEPTFIRTASVFPEVKSFLQSSWVGPGGVRHHSHKYPSINLQQQKVLTILFYYYIAYFMSDYVFSRHEKDNSKSWSFYSLVLKIPFKLRLINFLELFSKVMFNENQVCCREQLITLTCFLFLTSNFWWTATNTFTLIIISFLLYFHHKKYISNFPFTKY